MIFNILTMGLEAFRKIFALMGYVMNGNSFPQPLSAAEEQRLFADYKNGDLDAKNTLIEHNLRLVVHVVKKYAQSGKDQEDLISIGTIGLIKAINTFNPDKGIRLATYAAKCIDNEILMLMRSSKKHHCEVSMYDPIGTDNEGNEINLLDVLKSDSEMILDEVEYKIQVGKLYETLDNVLRPREKKILTLRYGMVTGKSVTQREIADLLGISRSYVSRIEKKAIKKLRKHYEVI